jgi:hypothetical protein
MNTQELLRKKTKTLSNAITMEQIVYELKRDGVQLSRSTIQSFLQGKKISERSEQALQYWIDNRKDEKK